MQYLYLLRAGNYYKVGISHNAKSRVSTLQPHIPDKIYIVCTKFLDTQAYDAEQELHKVLADYKADGANEWFNLTPEQAIDLCIRINQYPDIDISDRVTLATIANNVKRNQKLIEGKLDRILNTYQKDLIQSPIFTYVLDEPKATVQRESISQVDKIAQKTQEEQELFEHIIEFVKHEGRASTSLLQRKFSIGYGRAARIIEQLEDQKIIGPHNGSKSRTVLVRP